MNLTGRISLCLTLAAVALWVVYPAQAALNGPTYPAPGGNSFTTISGSSGSGSGRTNSYSGFNPSSYGDLYWGLDDTTAPSLSFSITGSETTNNPYSGSELMTYSPGASNLSGGIVVWSGSSVMGVVNTSNGTMSYPTVPTEFILKVTDTSGNPLALTSATSLGLPANVGGVLHVQGNYHTNLLFEGQNPSTSTFQPALDMYNSFNHPTDGSSHYDASFSGGFYSTPPSAAPEPGQFSLLVLVAAGLGGLLLRAHKRTHHVN